MYGVNRDEGSIVVAMLFPELNSQKTVLTKEKVRADIEKLHVSSPHAAEIADFYLKSLKSEDEANQDKLSHYYSYRLTQPLRSRFPFGDCTGWKGVCHIEDVVYLFAVNSSQPEDYKLSKEMLVAWTNFAKTGSPGKLGQQQVEWTEALSTTSHFTNHMNLDSRL
ncbi:Carboxylesterase 5A [Tyrophagus putrescentiae]|nr:Carboxylesterase 5A [Tyrophagus putrescentiae]